MEEIRAGNFVKGIAIQSEISNKGIRKAKLTSQSNEIEELIKRVGLLLESSKPR
ncbi:MAG: hypothetical protein ACI9WC_001121 [Arenicella sp.]|jgi:hypothetical protein